MNMTMYAIMNMYVESVDKARFVDRQIASMLSSLDPFSEYLPPVKARSDEQALQGFRPKAGIGIEGNTVGDRFYVTYVSPASDAYACGLRGGDEITAVDGTPMADIKDGVFARLNGDEGTSLALNVRHADGKEAAVQVKRMFLPSSTVKSYYMIDKTTGFIAITMFADNTISDFRKAVATLKKQGMKRLILDVQNNGGGLFDSAVALADEFLDGTKTIVSTRGAHIPDSVACAVQRGVMESGRLVLLVGGQTKSAAEIFSGAIRDWDRGVLVGATTFGKGLIQETLPFSDGSALRITVAKYLTPSGMSIQRPYGQMAAADTTKVWHSMLNGRPLKCTGGVSPDVYVPADTAHLSRWYGYITYSGVQKVAARNYIIAHRAELMRQYPKAERFISSFNTPDGLMEEVRRVSESAGIPVDDDGYSRSEPYLRTQMKALLCRDMYGDDNLYYKIMNSENSTINKAVEIIKSKEYDTILKNK